MRLVLLHIQCPIYKLEKGGQGAHDIFRRGGHWPQTMRHVTYYYFKREAFSQEQIKHLFISPQSNNKHFLKTKVGLPNLGTPNVILDIFTRTGVQKCQPFLTHSTLIFPK